MGLISDYLEHNREQMDTDLCLFIPQKKLDDFELFLSPFFLHSTVEETNRLANEERAARNKELKRDLLQLREISEQYIEREKLIRYLLMNAGLQSEKMRSILNSYAERVLNARIELYEWITKIEEVLGRPVVETPIAVDKLKEKETVIRIIMKNVLIYLQRTEGLKSYQVRELVKDCSKILMYQNSFKNQMEPSKMVKYYYQNVVGIQSSYRRCENCRSQLLKDIPYCLQCFERN